MKIKHTPGPWTNHGRIPQLGLPHSAVAAKTLIARVYSEAFNDEEQETANACLIAAAPELLDALSLMVEQICNPKNADHTLGAFAYGARISEALAVIAKATGVQS